MWKIERVHAAIKNGFHAYYYYFLPLPSISLFRFALVALCVSSLSSGSGAKRGAFMVHNSHCKEHRRIQRHEQIPQRQSNHTARRAQLVELVLQRPSLSWYLCRHMYKLRVVKGVVVATIALFEGSSEFQEFSRAMGL